MTFSLPRHIASASAVPELPATVFNENLLHHLYVYIYLSLKHIICSLNVVERVPLPSCSAPRLRRHFKMIQRRKVFIIRSERNALKYITRVCKAKLFKRLVAWEMTKSLSVYPQNKKKRLTSSVHSEWSGKQTIHGRDRVKVNKVDNIIQVKQHFE